MKVNHENYQFVLEPIHTQGGVILAYELLTKFNTFRKAPSSPPGESSLFAALPIVRRVALFEEQLDVVEELHHKCENLPIISVNIDADISDHFLTNVKLLHKIGKLKQLRFEVSEEFSHLNHTTGEKMLHRISQHCPLWLDDFGTGNSNLITIINRNFEYVKIDKHFFWRYCESNAFVRMIDHIKSYCKGIIVEGVENDYHKKILQPLDIAGLQGYAWSAINLELPILPQAANR